MLPAALFLGGCAATSATLPDDRPGDFALLITVYPVEADKTALPDPRWLRPARYAVDPDGRLRAESGIGVSRPGFPPLVRELDPGEVDRLYALAAQAGPGQAEVPGPQVFTPPADRRVALLEISAEGRVRAAQHDADADTPLAPLLRELARLSWLDRD